MANYPRLLKLDKDTKEGLILYLDRELTDHRSERQDYVDNIIKWQKDYWAEPSVEVRTFPFKGAANIIIPLTAITFEAVHARSMMKLYGLDQFTSAEVFKRDLPSGSDVALERFMDFHLKAMKAKKSFNDIATEQEKFGTGIGKNGYVIEKRIATRTIGDEEEDFEVLTKHGPTIDPVAGPRFLMRFTENDPQTAAWCGEEHSWTPHQVQVAEDSGLFEKGTMESLKAWISNSNTSDSSGSGQSVTHAQAENESREPVFPKRRDYVEVWLAWDVDGKPVMGFDEYATAPKTKEIQTFYHHESRVLMGTRYNWKDDLSRPYRLKQYIPLEHRWNGIGICKQCAQFQKEVTTIHRQRLDNATLANMRMFKVHKLSGYGPREPIFPGKMWFLDDMDYIESFQMGEVYNSSFANEQSSVLYHQQYSGVNEITLGMPSVGTPGTATGDLARIQEGSKKGDFTFSNLKDLIDELLIDTFINIKQFGSKHSDYFNVVENGDLVLNLLNQPVDQIRSGLLFKIETVKQQSNRLSSRNDWTQVAGMLQQYYTSSIELAMGIGDQQLAQVIMKKALFAATEAMRQILETFDIRNISRITLVDLLESMERQANGQGALPPGSTGNTIQGGNPRAGGINQAPGMDAFSQVIAALGQRG